MKKSVLREKRKVENEKETDEIKPKKENKATTKRVTKPKTTIKKSRGEK